MSDLNGLPIDRLTTRPDAIVLLFGSDRVVVGIATVLATTVLATTVLATTAGT